MPIRRERDTRERSSRQDAVAWSTRIADDARGFLSTWEKRLGDRSKNESSETHGNQPEVRPAHAESRLLDEDVLSVYGDPLAGDFGFDHRTSWVGGPVEHPDDDPLLGTTLHDTYAVSRVIGEGGMGRIYEARHTRIASKRFALKVLHAQYARNPEIRQRFQHEVEAAAKIEHAGVVGTYDVGETPGSGPYMVCEFLEGEDLNDYLNERGALSAHTVVHIGKQLCGALGAAHARGVIHRDLKPHNVFVLSREGASPQDSKFHEPSVKVLDFGLSRFIERDADLTKTGIILGTPGYMAPEQAGGLPTDHRTDIYGIGALLYATATGRAPFKEESPQMTVLSVLRQAPPRPRELVPSIPIELEIVIQRAMARDASDRYESVEAMGVALAELDASGVLFERRAKNRSVGGSSPRLQLLLSVFALLLAGVPAVSLAVFSVFQGFGVDLLAFRPSVLEWFLFGLLLLVLLFPLALLFRVFRGRVWSDSSRLAELLPRLRRTLLAATVAYGVSALVLISASGIKSLGTGKLGAAGSSALHFSTLSWFFVLPLNALLAASAAILWETSRRLKSPALRALSGVGYSAGVSVAGLVVLLSVVFAPSLTDKDVFGASSARESAFVQVAKTKRELEASAATSGDSASQTTAASPAGDVGAPGNPETLAVADAPKIAVAEPSSSEKPAPRARASAGELAMAQGRGAEALEELLNEYPRDGNILKAIMLTHASRADTLDLSAQTISRLFAVEPEFQTDSDVLFILKKALIAQGAPHKTAFEIVRGQMGLSGGELVFQLLSEQPKYQSRMKNVFFELRKDKRVSAATSIAYDLRFATSCQGRISLLERAEKDGDLRSVHQLLALATAPKSCGWGWRTCKPLCPVEAKQFRESAQAIQTRLDGR